MERVIDNSSQELFTEVINTIPIYPTGFGITMLARGIPRPKNPSELEGYISNCDNNNIIPFSQIEFSDEDIEEAKKSLFKTV